jgi:hypothetical protein
MSLPPSHSRNEETTSVVVVASDWSSAEWRESAVSWINRQLADANIRRMGDVELVRRRPWGTVLKTATSHGVVWFKASGPNTAFEIGLYELLQRVNVECVVKPIGLDLARSWILLPDGGPSLVERFEGPALVEKLKTVLPKYAQLQRDLAPHLTDLLTLGVSDMRPTIMPSRFAQAFECIGEYVRTSSEVQVRETYARAAALRKTYQSWCSKLAGAPGGSSLDHNDLHGWNILISGAPDHERMVFYDWGDSVIAHPFASMLVTLGWLQAHYLKVHMDAPEVRLLRDAYLEPFGTLGSRADLIEVLELACRVGKVARALTWYRALATEPHQPVSEFADAPFQCLASLTDDSYLGGA